MAKLYIFGSGASKCAGLPVTNEVMSKVIQERKIENLLQKKIQDRILKDVSSNILINEYHKELEKLEEVYKKYIDEKQIDQEGSIEGFLDWLKNKNKDTKVDFLETIIYWYLWDRDHHVEATRYHKMFVELLKRDDVIISFNYDIILERAIEDFRSTEIPKKYSYDPDNCAGKRLILKPMGSINWLRGFKLDDRLTYKDDEKGLEKEFVLSEKYLLDREEQIFNMPDFYDYSGGFNIFAVNTGIDYKLRDVKPLMKWFQKKPESKELLRIPLFKKIFDRAKNEVLKCDRLISFGYSFPDSDSNFLAEIFAEKSKPLKIEMVCGKSFHSTWNQQICYKNSNKTFEEWVLKNAEK